MNGKLQDLGILHDTWVQTLKISSSSEVVTRLRFKAECGKAEGKRRKCSILQAVHLRQLDPTSRVGAGVLPVHSDTTVVTACVGTFEALPEFSLHVELDLFSIEDLNTCRAHRHHLRRLVELYPSGCISCSAFTQPVADGHYDLQPHDVELTNLLRHRINGSIKLSRTDGQFQQVLSAGVCQHPGQRLSHWLRRLRSKAPQSFVRTPCITCEVRTRVVQPAAGTRDADIGTQICGGHVEVLLSKERAHCFRRSRPCHVA